MQKTGAVIPEDVPSWAVLRTSARWEKKIADSLQAVDVAAYVPTMKRVVQYATKRHMTEIPLFSGYVFCSETAFIGNPRVSPAIRKQIAQILRPSDPEQLRKELEHIARIVGDHELIQERVYGSPGDHVRIISGPLCGSQGVVLALKPKKRVLVLEVSFLGARLEVEVEEHQVKKED